MSQQLCPFPPWDMFSWWPAEAINHPSDLFAIILLSLNLNKRRLAWLFKIALILAICWDESSTRAYNRNSQIVLGRWQTDVPSSATMQIRWRRSLRFLSSSADKLFVAIYGIAAFIQWSSFYPSLPPILQHNLQLGTLDRKERVHKLTLNHSFIGQQVWDKKCPCILLFNIPRDYIYRLC